MDKQATIYVAGHTGLAGSAIVRSLRRSGHENLILVPHRALDLTDHAAVRQFFEANRPDYVFLAAARVGGILANSEEPAQFIRENLQIQTNVIHQCWRSGVKRLLFLGSSCIYPRSCPQPIREEALLTGELERTNEAYAIAKIAGIQMCAAYNQQYGTQFLCAMPTNLYGPNDRYELRTSHLIPALIRKAHDAKASGSKEMVAWGSGRPRRELLYSDDFAEACRLLMDAPWDATRANLPERSPLINVGTGVDHSIDELATLVAEIVGFSGKISWDTGKPDGVLQKRLDIGRIAAMGWKARIELKDGIRLAYEDFLTNKRWNNRVGV